MGILGNRFGALDPSWKISIIFFDSQCGCGSALSSIAFSCSVLNGDQK